MGSLKSAYKSARGIGELDSSLVAFVDILGFSRAVEKANQTGTAPELLRHFGRFIHTWRRALLDRDSCETRRRRSWEVRVFSDNIVISHPIMVHELSGDFEMGGLLDQLRLLQLGAIEHGFFMRGGLALGDMFVDSNIIYGPALVDAYRTESCIADNPRIVLADSATDFVLRRLGSRPKHSPYVRHILRDEDDRLFVNYLDACFHSFVAPSEVQWIEQHRDATARNLEKFRNEPRVGPKYIWVARYHNFWCRTRGLDKYILSGAGVLAARTLEMQNPEEPPNNRLQRPADR